MRNKLTKKDEFVEFLHKFLSSARVAVFQIPSSVDGITTYIRLNHEGVSLRDSDLLKAEILKRVDIRGRSEFHKESYLPFEALFPKAKGKKSYENKALESFYKNYFRLKRPGKGSRNLLAQGLEQWDGLSGDEVVSDLSGYAKHHMSFMGSSFQDLDVPKFVLEGRYEPSLLNDLWIFRSIEPWDDLSPFLMVDVACAALSTGDS